MPPTTDPLPRIHRLLKNRRAGLITNHTGVNASLAPTAVLLREHLTCLFGPEHGLWGAVQDELPVGDARDRLTGLPVYSLFGDTLAPPKEALDAIDTLVFDIQDVGVRFYTYGATMALAMEAAHASGKRFIVLDRPNPLGRRVSGLLRGEAYKSFLSYLPTTTRHGMTLGEIALMLADTAFPGLDVHVVKAQGWQPDRVLRDGSISAPWVPPSPNLPTLATVSVYPGACLVEGTNVSEGRGTTKPFETIGAPWLDAYSLAGAMNALSLAGCAFEPCFFTPLAFKHKNTPCEGVRIHITDYDQFDAVRMGVWLIHTLREQSGPRLTWRHLPEYGHYMADLLHGDASLREGQPPERIFAQMERDETAFAEASLPYRLY